MIVYKALDSDVDTENLVWIINAQKNGDNASQNRWR